MSEQPVMFMLFLIIYLSVQLKMNQYLHASRYNSLVICFKWSTALDRNALRSVSAASPLEYILDEILLPNFKSDCILNSMAYEPFRLRQLYRKINKMPSILDELQLKFSMPYTRDPLKKTILIVSGNMQCGIRLSSFGLDWKFSRGLRFMCVYNPFLQYSVCSHNVRIMIHWHTKKTYTWI